MIVYAAVESPAGLPFARPRGTVETHLVDGRRFTVVEIEVDGAALPRDVRRIAGVGATYHADVDAARRWIAGEGRGERGDVTPRRK